MTRPTLWIDITELFDHFAAANYPTGVSRVVLALADELVRDPGSRFDAARPIFWHPVAGRPMQVSDGFDSLSWFFLTLRDRYAEAGMAPRPHRSRLARGLVTAVPKPLRYALFPAEHGVTKFAGWAKRERLTLTPVRFAADDCLFVPGSFWLGRYAPRLADEAIAARAAVVAFVHDVLLLSNPEWLGGHHSEQFRRGADAFLPKCAAIACNSAYTRDELRSHVTLPRTLPISVCRLADVFDADIGRPQAPPGDTATARPFALAVSSILPRKNHRLLIDAWMLLAEQRGTDIPALVFAGGGAPDAELAASMDAAQRRGVIVRRMTGLDDTALDRLYREAWVTLYPSLGEGYGLPVAEALARGKICFAVPRGGVMEIAPSLIDPIDPNDPQALAAKVAAYLDDPARLAAREAEIRSAYRSTRWGDTAAAVRSLLERASFKR